MPLQYLIDEHLRGTLAVILARLARRDGLEIDIMQVGDVEGPALGCPDEELLRWSEVNEQILVSRDRRTLPEHLARHLSIGHGSPGIILLRDQSLTRLAEHLLVVAHASDPSEWSDRITYVP